MYASDKGVAAEATARAVSYRHSGGTDSHERSLQPQACSRLPRHCPPGGRYGYDPRQLGLWFQPGPHPRRGWIQESLIF